MPKECEPTSETDAVDEALKSLEADDSSNSLMRVDEDNNSLNNSSRKGFLFLNILDGSKYL